MKFTFIQGIVCLCFVAFGNGNLSAQEFIFNRDISPSEGWGTAQEKPYRQEICLNGRWDFQPVAVPEDWKYGMGIPPVLTDPSESGWENTKIKIPSPWNVNEWGGGSKTGAGTDRPYSPSSVYYPSYPQSWGGVRMGWLRRSFEVPQNWKNERIILHFEAVIGDCVVLVNGKKAGSHFSAYLPFEFDITDLVKNGQSNELLVGVRHRKLFDKTSEKYKYFRSTYPPGSNTDHLVGIWQDVYLLAVPAVRVTDVFVKPWVDRDELELDVELTNQTSAKQEVSVSGPVKEWVNKSGKDVLSAPEINWELGKTAIEFPAVTVNLLPGETKEITLSVKVNGKLKLWAPETPNLYMAQLQISKKGKSIDCKTQRFGWRQFVIKDGDFYLNGTRIQCFADIQHPFGAYICSRRFAWAWYKMIQNFGGNCVRLHAQPWPRMYYDLADEMGLMVLDEGALFGSSLSLNFEEDITWKRTAEHLDALVMRDRNHPSVIGWSAGNELFAIPMYNKPDSATAKIWNVKIITLAKRPAALDPTRAFITDDGDEDMQGNLPVWSKHFGHGMQLNRLPHPDIDKPLIVGENGATYYGRPEQLFQFAGEQAYASYYGRNEALAVDIYQNVAKMARPLLDYFSPSEVCWFGLEHLNLGYHDYLRLPDMKDGIFAGKPYQEGKPGYQIERIPPYVSTFNPGLDPTLPLYKPLPMFEALKAALSGKTPQPCPWDTFRVHQAEARPEFPQPIYPKAYLTGDANGILAQRLKTSGMQLADDPQSVSLAVIDGEHITNTQLNAVKPLLDRLRKNGGLIWVILSGNSVSPELTRLLPGKLNLTDRRATSLQSEKNNEVGKYFRLPDLYFSEINGDREIIKHGMSGPLVDKSDVVIEATNADWSLFNQVGENRKCAQVVLYEHLQKPSGAALIHIPFDKSDLWISTIDYKIESDKTDKFWKDLCKAMRINTQSDATREEQNRKKAHDLLLDGPVNN